MNQKFCKKCGSVSLYTELKGNQTGLYCSDCGAWIKWLNKNERRAFEHNQKLKNTKLIEDNTKIGEWVYGEFDIPHCSECGKEVLPCDISPYCPNCGAKMEG